MSKFVDLTQRAFRPNLARLPVVFALLVASVVSLWFVVAPRAEAVTLCDVCHKGVLTVSTVCSSLDYRRHKDHGDADGPCSMTTSSAFLKPAHGPAAAKRNPNQ